MATKKSLEAAAATSKLFSGATEQEKTIGNGNTVYEKSLKERSKGKTITIQTVENPTKETDQEQKKKSDTAMFSCRMDADVIAKWKAYTKVGGYGNIGDMTVQALSEYMDKHKLSEEEETKYKKLYEAYKL